MSRSIVSYHNFFFCSNYNFESKSQQLYKEANGLNAVSLAQNYHFESKSQQYEVEISIRQLFLLALNYNFESKSQQNEVSTHLISAVSFGAKLQF